MTAQATTKAQAVSVEILDDYFVSIPGTLKMIADRSAHGCPTGDLREEPRFHVENEPATVTTLEGQNKETMPAYVLDVSRKGLGLSTNQRVPQDTWIKVELRHALIFGEVKHCTRDAAGGFRVGINADTVILRDKEPGTDQLASPEHRGLLSILTKLRRRTPAA